MSLRIHRVWTRQSHSTLANYHWKQAVQLRPVRYRAMSALGQKQTSVMSLRVSALPPKADIEGCQSNVPRSFGAFEAMEVASCVARRDHVATTLDRLVNRPAYRTDDAVCGQ